MVPVLVLLFVVLWFILQGDLFCLALCYFVLVFFSLFSIATTSLGEERANLGVYFFFFFFFFFSCVCSICACLVLSVSSCVWEGLRLVIVVLPRLCSYLFCGYPCTTYHSANVFRPIFCNLYSSLG